MFLKAQQQIETVSFEPTRRAGLERLEKFVSRAGAHYSSQRHYDFGSGDHSGVSALSAWIKHRLVTEEEILAKTLTHHNLQSHCDHPLEGKSASLQMETENKKIQKLWDSTNKYYEKKRKFTETIE